MSGAITTPTGTLSARQIAGYAAAAGFTGQALVTAVAVALAESGGNPTVTPVNTNGSRDRGLWQINSVHGGADRDLWNPATNAAYAYKISNGGASWSPWVAWKNNNYVPYLERARSAVGELGTIGGNFQGIAGGGLDDIPIIGGVVDDATESVINALLPVGMQVVFSVAALGLIALGLSRLTERSPTELFSTATKFTGVGGIAKAVAV